MKILIIVGGNKHKIEPFVDAGKKLGVDVTIASFSELNFNSEVPFVLRVAKTDVKDFDIIYIRVIGKRLEEASLLVNYALENNVPLVDEMFEHTKMMPLSLSKSIETMKLIQNEIKIPKTIFGSLDYILENGEKELGFPYVIKGTTGKKAKEVWSPETKEALEELVTKLKEEEANGKRFFAQEFSKASQRMRVFVLGGRVIAGITRPTRWRKRFIEKVNGEFPEGIKERLDPIPQDAVELAVRAVNAAKLTVSGVDVVREDDTGELYLWEVNSAPAWGAVAKDTGLNIQEEILKYLINRVNGKN